MTTSEILDWIFKALTAFAIPAVGYLIATRKAQKKELDDKFTGVIVAIQTVKDLATAAVTQSELVKEVLTSTSRANDQNAAVLVVMTKLEAALLALGVEQAGTKEKLDDIPRRLIVVEEILRKQVKEDTK